VLVKRALFGWALWVAMVPLVYGAAQPKPAEAALPLVIIGGVAYAFDAPIVAAYLALGVAVLGEVYCANDAECAEFVQGVVDAAPAWLIAGMHQAIANGLGVFNVSLMDGYDADEVVDAFEVAALAPDFTQRTLPSSHMVSVVNTVGSDPVNIVRSPTMTFGTAAGHAALWESPHMTVPATFTNVSNGAVTATTGWRIAFPRAGTLPTWAGGTEVCGTSTGALWPSLNCAVFGADLYQTNGGTNTWPTTAASYSATIPVGAEAVFVVKPDSGAGGTFYVEVADFWYQWTGASSTASVWTRVPVLAGTFWSGLAIATTYTGQTGTPPTSNVAVPATTAGMVGTLLTPTTQVTTVNGGTVPISGGADVVGAVNTGFLGLAALMTRVATAVETIADWVSDFPAQLSAALTTALDDALSAAFVPTTTAEARITALADVVATKAPVSYVVKVQDAWEDATAYGADCPSVSVPYAPWSQTEFEMCLPSGVSTWTRAFSEFVAAAGVALWAWGFYRRLVE